MRVRLHPVTADQVGGGGVRCAMRISLAIANNRVIYANRAVPVRESESWDSI